MSWFSWKYFSQGAIVNLLLVTTIYLFNPFHFGHTSTTTTSVNNKIESTITKIKNGEVYASSERATTPADFCLQVPVLLYHHIEPLAEATEQGHPQLTVDSAIFDQQMQYLKENGYTTITAESLIDAINERRELPAKSIVITVDDGYDDNYNYAYPIAKKHSVILNIFIATGLLGTNDFLTWNQVKEMSQSPFIHMYDHTVSHFSLNMGNPLKAEWEIMMAKADLEKELANKISVFAYPYGAFTPEAIDILSHNKFKGAYSTLGGTMQCASFIMTLHRTHVGNYPLSGLGL